MKNFRVLLMILGIISNICGCKSLTGPEFYYDPNTIASVEIVLLGESVPESLTFEETVLSKIDNVAEFLSRINTVERRPNWGEPICITEGDVAVKIVYSSGEYDLLTYDAQVLYRDGQNRTGYTIFDQAKFDALIAEYTNLISE